MHWRYKYFWSLTQAAPECKVSEDDGDVGVAEDAPKERLFGYDGRDDGDYFDSSYL